MEGEDNHVQIRKVEKVEVTETRFRVQIIRRLMAGMVGGFLAGMLILAFALVLVDPSELAGALKVLLVGSIFLGMFLGVIEYREIGTGAWISLLVAVYVSLCLLGFLIAFAIKEALEVETTWGIMANLVGGYIGAWTGRLVNSKFLLPKARSQVHKNEQSFEESY